MAKNYRGAKFNPSNYNGDSTSNNLNPSSSLGFNSNNYDIPDVPKANEIKPKSDLDLFREKMNKERGENTPSFIKGLYNTVIDPVAYAIDKTIYNNPLSQRTLVKAGETITGEGGMKNYDGSTLEAKDAGKVGNFVADSAGMLLGMKSIPIGNSNLLGMTDKAGQVAEGLIAKNIPNPIINKIGSSMVRGAVDNGIGTAALDLKDGKDKNTILKDTYANALGGALLFGGGKAIGEGLSNLKGAKNPQIELPIIKPNIETKVNQIETMPTSQKVNPYEGKKFTVKNTKLEEAYKEYDSAIEEIHNYIGHWKLEPGELEKASKDLGINMDSIIRKIEDAQANPTNIKNASEKSMLARVAGVNNQPLPKLIEPLPKKNIPILDTPLLKQSNISNKSMQEIPKFTNVKNEVAISGNVTGLNQNVSEFKNNTMRKSPILATEDAQKVIDDIHATYNVKPNEQSLNRAMADLETNPSEVVKRIRSSSQLNGAEDTVAAGIITKQLRENAEKTGDYTELKSWLEEIQPKVTETAQSLQALSTWKKLTPEGALMKAQQVVGKANREGEKAFGDKWKKVELTNDDMKFINDKMKEIEGMGDGRAKDIEFAKVKQFIAEKIPPSASEKIKSLQRISLLLNTKTMTRNILGNVVMGTLENIKDVPGAIIDKAVSGKFNGERTTLMPSLTGLKTQLKGGVKGAKETLVDYKLGVNTSPTQGQFDLPETKSFRKGPFSKLEGLTNFGLTLGDRPFWQGAYDETLRQQMKIKSVTEPTEEMINMAKQVADDRTFQNAGILVDSFKKLQSALNLGKNIGLGNAVMPFVKTPANILSKAIDYSPVGGANGILKLVKGKGTQKEIVDHLARSLTGSSLIGVGYLLAKNGNLQGQANKDYDVALLENQTGKMPYSIKIGDKYQTIDWAQPAAIPLMIGADMFHEGKSQNDVNSTIIEAVKSGGATLFNQSLLQGMSKLFGGYSESGGKNLTEGIINAGLQIPGQLVPSAFKQGAQLLDNNVRDTSSPSAISKEINKIKTKIPVLSTTLPQKVDTLGNGVEQFNGSEGLKYGFDVLFNPGYSDTYKPTEVEKYILDLYDKSGETIHFPRTANGYIDYATGKGKKERINLTSEEKMDLQKYIGEKTNDAFASKIPSIKNKSPKDQAKELQKTLTEIYNNGEAYILNKRGIKEYKGR